MKQATARLTALDTNVLARYYVQAEQADVATNTQCEQARALLESGKPLFVSTTVALELEWVLRGFYKLKPKTVADVFTHLLEMPHLQVQDRQALQTACDALAQGFDFADALHHASSRHCDVFATFDTKGFAKRASAHAWTPKVQALTSTASL
jgi:predicted nucleic-acid-binding protein